MKILQRYIAYIFLLIAVVIVSGCTANEKEPIRPDDNEVLPAGYKAIELRLNIEPQRAKKPEQMGRQRIYATNSTEKEQKVRAYGIEPGDHDKDVYPADLNENKIETLDIFFFEKSNGKLIKHITDRDGDVIILNHQYKDEDNERYTQRVTIKVPKHELSLYLNKQPHIYVIVNKPDDIAFSANITETEILELKHKKDLLEVLQTGKPQQNFVMEGHRTDLSEPISWSDNKNRHHIKEIVLLERLAAKIRLRIGKIEIPEYELPDENFYTNKPDWRPNISLVRYPYSTRLVKGKEPLSSSEIQWSKIKRAFTLVKKNFSNLVDVVNPTKNLVWTSPLPLYTYENDWTKNNDADETYILLTVPLRLKGKNWQGQENEGFRKFYYRIPVNYRMPIPNMDETEKAGIGKIQRNHLYDIYSEITVLGNEDDSDPIEIQTNISIQPWRCLEIDASIDAARYLIVRENHPLMPNQDKRKIEYATSHSVEIITNKAWFSYYDVKGKLMIESWELQSNGNYKHTYYNENGDQETKYENSIPQLSINLIQENSLKYISIEHPVPTNYVPFHIELTVKHKKENGVSEENLLSEYVHVEQFPPIYVTGKKSVGFVGGTSQVDGIIYTPETAPDFRFQNPIGAISNNEISKGAQTLDVFNRVRILVPHDGMKIGVSIDSQGHTKRDDLSNEMISPEFIIASQHGMSTFVRQYDENPYDRGIVDNGDEQRRALNGSKQNTRFGSGYGPISNFFDHRMPYSISTHIQNPTQTHRTYATAEERCEKYFEGEYGADGYYWEFYRDRNHHNQWNKRHVYKTFKYKGHWRIPTKEELKLIYQIQSSKIKTVKSLLWGLYYWTAKTGVALDFTNGELTQKFPDSAEYDYHNWPAHPYVRCVFDTWKLKDNNGVSMKMTGITLRIKRC
ncbi:hypothetical protein [Porphyromonas macacae]|uniref:fimbrial tip adhesin FimD n=1 Tax=Porphyromonas macacae TaxID=28115 RepID=UPI000B074B4C|nr:hypothetical protein [Porphyromonas macacae]